MASKLKTAFKVLAFGIAVLITLIALAWAEENWRGHRAWNKHRHELEAKGEVLDLARLIPPKVPDDKNFALCPLLKPLLEYQIQSNTVVWLDTNGLNRIQALDPDKPVPGRTNELILGNPEKGTFADLAACAAFYRHNSNYPQSPLSNAPPAEVILTALSKFAPELQELKEAAATRPYAEFPVHYLEQPYWNILLRHLAHIKGLTRLIDLRALAELEEGNADAASSDLQLGMRIAGSIRDEPLLISHLVRLAAVALNVQLVREGLVRHRWTDSELQRLERDFASIDLLREYKAAMRGERAFNIWGVDYLRRAGFHAQPMQLYDEKTGRLTEGAPAWILPSGWCYQNMVCLSRFHQQFTLPAVDEKEHRIYPEVTVEGTNWVHHLPAGPYTIFAVMLAPALEKPVLRSGETQTLVDQTRLACALERFRLVNGRLPENLASLTPDFIADIPNDVIDGKPLRYRLAPDGSYVIYSLGWNKSDDGGHVAWKKSSRLQGSLDPLKGDWVWTMPANAGF